MLFRSPTAKTPWAQPPPSSRGPGRCPFKAVTRVRIPLGARTAWSCGAAWSARHPVKVEVAGSNPVRTAPGRTRVRPRAGSSVGTSVRLKIGRSAVRPRPCPPHLCRSAHCRPVSGVYQDPFANAFANTRSFKYRCLASPVDGCGEDVGDSSSLLAQDVGVARRVIDGSA